MSGSRPMISPRPSRTMRWSSTHSTRIRGRRISAILRGRGDRHDSLDARAMTIAAGDREPAPEIFGALLQARQPIVAVGPVRRMVRVEADAVVRHCERDRRLAVPQLD